jgi:hypothetical protein
MVIIVPLPFQNFVEFSKRLIISLAHRPLVTGMTSPLTNWMLTGKVLNIPTLSQMKIMDKGLISSMPVGYLGELASSSIPRFWPHEN